MALTKSTVNKLKKIVGKSNFSMEAEDLACYSYDANIKGHLPEAVVFPGTTDEIAFIFLLSSPSGTTIFTPPPPA